MVSQSEIGKLAGDIRDVDIETTFENPTVDKVSNEELLWRVGVNKEVFLLTNKRKYHILDACIPTDKNICYYAY